MMLKELADHFLPLLWKHLHGLKALEEEEDKHLPW
jgi:hypothetical protein